MAWRVCHAESRRGNRDSANTEEPFANVLFKKKEKEVEMIRRIARTFGFTMVLATTIAASTALAQSTQPYPPSTQPYPQGAAPGYAPAYPQGTATTQPVDVVGTVAQFDRQNGVITFQDGRAVQLSSQSAVYQAAPGASTQFGNPSAWQPVLAASIQPGSQIYVHNAQMLSMAPARPNVAGAHVGTVKYVDPQQRLIALTDGSFLKALPSTQVQSGGRTLQLSDIKKGDQVAAWPHRSAVGSSSTVSQGEGAPASAMTADRIEVTGRS
jgi:hypothetical protein